MPLENQITVPKYISGRYSETVLTAQEISAVSITGNQTISGAKTFDIRPSVNGSGVLLSGDLPSLKGLVYSSGNQLISGAKRFVITPGKSFWVDNENVDSSQGWIYVDQNDASIGYNQNGLSVDNNGMQVSGPASFYGEQYFHSTLNLYSQPDASFYQIKADDQTMTFTKGDHIIFLEWGLASYPYDSIAYNSKVVHLDGNETIYGNKVFKNQLSLDSDINPGYFINIQNGDGEFLLKKYDFTTKLSIDGFGVGDNGDYHLNLPSATGAHYLSFPIRKPYGSFIAVDQEVVHKTGQEVISGVKTFASRPTVNGTGVLLSGEAASLPTTIVYTTGNQTISGVKTFTDTLNTNKTIYVDAIVGTDTRTNLSKYSMGSPFATIDAAVAASATLDTIRVRAGTYTISSTIILNLKGNLFFEAGTTVNIALDVVAFSYSQNSVPISILGYANFVLAGGTAGVLTMPSGNAATAVQFECNSISGPNSATGTLFNCAVGALSVDAKLIQMTTTFLSSNATVFNITGSGAVTARIPFVYCGVFVNGAGAANVGSGALARVNADVWTLITFNTTAGMNLNLITTNFRIVNYTHFGVGAALSWTENTTVEFHVFQGLTWNNAGSQPHITFDSSAGSTSLKQIRLNGTNTMRYASPNSLSSNVAINVSTNSTFAAVPATANITFKLGSFTVDSEINNF